MVPHAYNSNASEAGSSRAIGPQKETLSNYFKKGEEKKIKKKQCISNLFKINY